MCITASVGPKGKAKNDRQDVKLVQVLLNLNLYRLLPLPPLAMDGQIGKNTLDAIAEFQRQHMPALGTPDSVVDPAGGTLKELRNGIPAGMALAKMQGIMIEATEERVKMFYEPINDGMNRAHIDTALRMAHFLAQLGHESGDLRYTEEIASGSAYEGRADLGNTQPGDGTRFKGRGLIQLTGRANYRAYGLARNVDYTVDGKWKLLATDPAIAADVACWFWESRNLNAPADRDDIRAVTRIINGGYNGLPDREAHLQRAKCLLGL